MLFRIEIFSVYLLSHVLKHLKDLVKYVFTRRIINIWILYIYILMEEELLYAGMKVLDRSSLSSSHVGTQNISSPAACVCRYLRHFMVVGRLWRPSSLNSVSSVVGLVCSHISCDQPFAWTRVWQEVIKVKERYLGRHSSKRIITWCRNPKHDAENIHYSVVGDPELCVSIKVAEFRSRKSQKPTHWFCSLQWKLRRSCS